MVRGRKVPRRCWRGFFAALGVLGLIGLAVLWLVPLAVPEGAAGFIQRGWVWPTGTFLFWTFVQAAGSLLAVGMMIRAYQIAEASRVSVFEYIILPASALWGWVIWGEVLTPLAVAGMVLIAAGGHRDRAAGASGGIAHRLAPVTAAERDIGFVPADLDLRAVRQRLAVRALADHHRGLLAAMADRADLAHLVGQASRAAEPGNNSPLKSTRKP